MKLVLWKLAGKRPRDRRGAESIHTVETGDEGGTGRRTSWRMFVASVRAVIGELEAVKRP